MAMLNNQRVIFTIYLLRYPISTYMHIIYIYTVIYPYIRVGDRIGED